MAGLKYINPYTAGTRARVALDRSELHKGKPLKKLTVGAHSTGGRNNQGRITQRFVGNGHKRTYRLIDFRRVKTGDAQVERIEYNPFASAFIALIKYSDGEHAYILAPQGVKPGAVVASGAGVDQKPGNCLPLTQIAVGTSVHNIETKPLKGGALVRAAGTSGQVMGRAGAYCIVRLPSGKKMLLHGTCRATIGTVSNPDHGNVSIGKAGRSRWMGRRGHVRGVAMNPVDHPMGGGEGRTSGGRHPVSPTGVQSKGKKTRKNKRTARFILK